MKRQAKIIDIIDRIENLEDSSKRIGRTGFILTQTMHPGYPFSFIYEDGIPLSGSRIVAVKRVPQYLIVVTKHRVYVFEYLDMDKKFYDYYKTGEIELDEIDYYIEEWHNSNGVENIIEFCKEYSISVDFIEKLDIEPFDIGIDEFLGLTDSQYAKFLEKSVIPIE